MNDAADIRTRGDATADQRRELRELLQTKRYTLEWRTQFYADVTADNGLSEARAKGVLNWLREQPDLDDTPAHADAGQIDRIEELLPQRIAPGPWAKLVRTRIASGTMTHDEAARYLTDLERLPKKTFTAPACIPAGDAPTGYFAVTHDDDKVRCYRVHTDRGGRPVVDLFTGPKPGQRRRLHGYKATHVLKLITAAGPAAAGRLFATTRKHCCDCNQPIRRTDQPGYPDGLGFDCWQERQAAAALASAEPPEGTEAHA